MAAPEMGSELSETHADGSDPFALKGKGGMTETRWAQPAWGLFVLGSCSQRVKATTRT